MLKFLFGHKHNTRKTPATVSNVTALDDLIARGNVLEDAGDIDGALRLYEETTRMDPAYWRGFINLGNALRAKGRLQDAAKQYRTAINLNPEHAGAHINLGTTLLGLGDASAAEANFRIAMRLKPEWAETWFGLGCALEDSSTPEEAIAAYRKTLERDSTHVTAAVNLASLLLKQGDSKAARDVLGQYPDDPRTTLTMAHVEAQTGHPENATTAYRQLLASAPDDFSSFSSYLFTLNFIPDIDAKTILEEHRRFGERLAERTRPMPKRTACDSEKRLRIGYVSPDFRAHPVSCFVEPILRNHDRDAVEVHCYYDHHDRDQITERFIPLADRWHSIAGLGDEEVAHSVANDGIDILIDLAGHTTGNRLPMFARKPAPLQFTWLGYLCTTGVAAIDYRICDAHTDPLGEAEHWQIETPARLPNSQWCYLPQVASPEPSVLPMLRNGYCTFGSFNQAAKLNEPLLRLWANVLTSAPDSRLKFIGVTDKAQATEIRQIFAALGIRDDRLDVIGRVNIDEYFRCYREVDIALDTFPYNGATTTCDALIMGVPVATLAGHRSIARGCASLLGALGLTDWIADAHEGFVELLKQQLRSPERMAELRASLPQRMRSSSLMDGAGFTRDLETLFRDAWRRKCAEDGRG